MPMSADVGKKALSGLGQKTVIFGNTRIMWAGKQLDARMAIKALFDASDEGLNFIGEDEARQKFETSGVDLTNVSLIYSYLDHKMSREWSVDCEQIGPSLVAAGSGEWDFFRNIVLPNRANPKDENEVFENLTAATFTKIAREIFSPEYDFFYGGWFELTGIKDGRFKKMPIALKIWPVVDGQALSTGPLFFSHYFDHHLALYTISMEKAGQGLQPKIRSQLVPDFLERTRPPGDPYGMQFEPVTIAHFFVRNSADGLKLEMNIHVEDFQPDAGFEVKSYRGDRGQPRLGMDFSAAYLDRMTKLANFGAPDAFGAPLTSGFGLDD
jgi:hypothetical protein